MTPFDTTTNSALAGRDLLKISGGILPLPGVAVAGYMSDDPSQSSSTQPVNYGTSVDVEAANFQIYVTQNTADTQSQFALLVNGTSIGSQNVAPGFTGATQVKAAQGLTIPAGSQIAMRISNPGTVGAGQHVKATGVLATVAQPSPARIYAPSFYFAGRLQAGSPNQGYIAYLGNDANESLFVSAPTASYPIGVSCFLSNVTIQIFSTAQATTLSQTTFSAVKNANSPTQQQVQFVVTAGILNTFSVSIPISASQAMSLLPGDTLACSVGSPGNVVSCAVTFQTARN